MREELDATRPQLEPEGSTGGHELHRGGWSAGSRAAVQQAAARWSCRRCDCYRRGCWVIWTSSRPMIGETAYVTIPATGLRLRGGGSLLGK